jgi:hypothetical protein
MKELTERIAFLHEQQNAIEIRLTNSITAVCSDLSAHLILEKIIQKKDENNIPSNGLNLIMDHLVDRFIPSKNAFNPIIKQLISKEVIYKLFKEKEDDKEVGKDEDNVNSKQEKKISYSKPI